MITPIDQVVPVSEQIRVPIKLASGFATWGKLTRKPTREPNRTSNHDRQSSAGFSSNLYAN